MPTIIQNSIKREYLQHTYNRHSAYEMLVSLKRKVSPNDFAALLDLRQQYKHLMKPPRQALDTWVNKWEEIYDRGIKLNMPELAAPSPHFDFLNAIQNILPHFYTINQDLVLKQARQNDIMEFTELLDTFRDAKRIQQAQQGKVLGGQSAFATSFQGEELGDTNKPEDKPSEPEPKPQNEQKPKRLRTAPKCLCGETHWFRDCPYVIPSVRKKD